MKHVLLLCGFAAAGATSAWGQADGGVNPNPPDEAWEGLGDALPPGALRFAGQPWEGLSAPPPAPPRGEARMPAPSAPPPLMEFNKVSMYGAPSLGQWNRGIAVYLGFPLLGARFAIGVLPEVDLGVAIDSLYGIMNDFRLHAKWQVFGDAHWSLAVAAEGGPALFTQSPQSENHGARWFTGRRNWNVAPGLIVSYRGDSPHSARVFADVRCAVAFDTEPYARFPLSGVPANVQVAANVPVRLGAEMPFSPQTSFVFTFGLDLHGRSDDSSFMIAVAVGIVTRI